jgi:hypothetical protein
MFSSVQILFPNPFPHYSAFGCEKFQFGDPFSFFLALLVAGSGKNLLCTFKEM